MVLQLAQLKASLESAQKLSEQLQQKMDIHQQNLLEVREEQAMVEDQLRKELMGQVCLSVWWGV